MTQLGDRDVGVTVSRFKHDNGTVHHDSLGSLDEAGSSIGSNWAAWINTDGVHDVEHVNQIGSDFNLHRLAIEDLVDTGQRPKAEDGDPIWTVSLPLRILKPGQA